MRKQRFPDRREKPTDTSTAGCRAQRGFLLLCRNEASIHARAPLSWMDLREGLIRLGFQERRWAGRKEIIIPGSRLLKRQDLE